MGRLVWVALAVLGYAVLSHVLMLYAADSPWAIAALLGPLVLTLTGLTLWRRQWWAFAALQVVVGGVAWVVWHGGIAELNPAYVLQHAGIHLALAWTFGSTLRSGKTALISALAERLHGERMTDQMRDYTRSLTGVWVCYFIIMASLSLLLYAWAPWSLWSAFANLVTPLALVSLLWGEHALRYRLHPHFDRVTVTSALKAYHRASLDRRPTP
jgi:uncharacterized membrane protein